MHTHKGLAPILWVIIAAVVLGGGYWAVQKSKIKMGNAEPTAEQTVAPVARKSAQSQTAVPADWKTYRNEEYGFEFRYPPHLVFNGDKNYIGEDGISSYPPFILVADFGFPENAAHYRFNLKATEYQSINAWFDQWREKAEEPFDYEGGGLVTNKVLDTLDMVIYGVPAKKIRMSGNFPTWNMFFAMVKDGRLYTLSYDGWLRDNERRIIDEILSGDEAHEVKIEKANVKREEFRMFHRSVFDKILPTFRFTK